MKKAPQSPPGTDTDNVLAAVEALSAQPALHSPRTPAQSPLSLSLSEARKLRENKLERLKELKPALEELITAFKICWDSSPDHILKSSETLFSAFQGTSYGTRCKALRQGDLLQIKLQWMKASSTDHITFVVYGFKTIQDMYISSCCGTFENLQDLIREFGVNLKTDFLKHIPLPAHRGQYVDFTREPYEDLDDIDTQDKTSIGEPGSEPSALRKGDLWKIIRQAAPTGHPFFMGHCTCPVSKGGFFRINGARLGAIIKVLISDSENKNWIHVEGIDYEGLNERLGINGNRHRGDPAVIKNMLRTLIKGNPNNLILWPTEDIQMARRIISQITQGTEQPHTGRAHVL